MDKGLPLPYLVRKEAACDRLSGFSLESCHAVSSYQERGKLRAPISLIWVLDVYFPNNFISLGFCKQCDQCGRILLGSASAHSSLIQVSSHHREGETHLRQYLLPDEGASAQDNLTSHNWYLVRSLIYIYIWEWDLWDIFICWQLLQQQQCWLLVGSFIMFRRWCQFMSANSHCILHHKVIVNSYFSGPWLKILCLKPRLWWQLKPSFPCTKKRFLQDKWSIHIFFKS